MPESLFHVRKPGVLTTVQDLGRYGYQQYGISPSGAVDQYAMKIANLLVGNSPGQAVIEATMSGPELEALQDTWISICGGNLSPSINGNEAPMWKAVPLKKGDVLSFGKPKNGMRAYISTAGGFAAEEVLGSKSTYVKGGIGGINGRPLKKGDTVHAKQTGAAPAFKRSLHSAEIPFYGRNLTIRIIQGPHTRSFSEKSVETFLSSRYEVTPESDRMGCRLSGPCIAPEDGADILSDAVPFGGIQVPASGQPIIMLSDRQTTGGYTRIGTVISVDIPLIAQAVPGSALTFQSVSVAEAQNLYLKEVKLMKQLEMAVREQTYLR
ncbi:biotin-dependent carboxyltransferase family protein [Bacillus marinisedimentorum]|uniref:5-oxoprolinase subunit C family protein n=1 Tax=Bacillus marinisedimentorum TaxID=1821260 RepID=UPI0007E20BEE|nr:biotin-dependent carboxyltransferase family protein [Bacillus marinisedimentorum]